MVRLHSHTKVDDRYVVAMKLAATEAMGRCRDAGLGTRPPTAFGTPMVSYATCGDWACVPFGPNAYRFAHTLAINRHTAFNTTVQEPWRSG